MMGLAQSITPSLSGRVKVHIIATVSNDTLNDGSTAQPAYGTGAAPANGAAATGTTFGPAKTRTALVAGEKTEVSWTWEISGLTVGTAYWFDLQLAAVTVGTASASEISVYLEEF